MTDVISDIPVDEGMPHDDGDLPLVTVLLPVYNGGAYLLPALRSIVDQSYANLEILIVDDGSTDGAVEHAVGVVDDPRILVMRHANMGLAPSLNRGIREASGSLIARMDADDVALPERIERQVARISGEPEIVLVGGQIIRLVGEAVRDSTSRFPLDSDRIVAGLRRTEHVLSHPAVMYRTDAARAIGGYWGHGEAEDWDFFLRISEIGELVNVPEPVLEYRFHGSGINVSALSTVRTNMRIAVINHRRRAKGRAELAPSDLLSVRWCIDRLVIRLQVASLRIYRRSLRARAEHRRAMAALELLASATLWPAQALRRVRQYRSAVTRKSSETVDLMTPEVEHRMVT